MAKKYRDLVKRTLSAEAIAEAETEAQKLLAEMPLAELRHARSLSQKEIAKLLKVEQPSISKLEKRTDMYISSLRNFIEAMGGELEIVARFPDGNVRINQFEDLEDKNSAAEVLKSGSRNN